MAAFKMGGLAAAVLSCAIFTILVEGEPFDNRR
jgi:hypothetical protein